MPRIIALLVLAAIAGFLVWVALGSDEPAVVSASSDASEPAAATAPRELETPPVLRDHPEDFTEVDAWLQSEATTLEEAKGEVTIVQFWTFGCYNCKNTLPHLREIYAEHHDDGLEIIGVHAPEFDYERDLDNVEEALVDLDVPWQVAIDNKRTNFGIWQSEGRRFWPRTYVIDAEGNIRFDHIGEGKYQELADTVEALLAEA